jgi:hypothetical protein
VNVFEYFNSPIIFFKDSSYIESVRVMVIN